MATKTTPAPKAPALPATSYRATTGARRASYPALASLPHGDGTAATTRDVLDWTAWLSAAHAAGLTTANVKPAIAQRAGAWLAAHDVPAPAVGDKVTVAYVARVLTALAEAGVPADALAAMREHYGA